MRYLIFDFQSNPSIDKPSFKLSEARGKELLADYRGELVGPRHIKLFAPKHLEGDDHEQLMAGGSMREAWHIKDSSGYLVWQLRGNNAISLP